MFQVFFFLKKKKKGEILPHSNRIIGIKMICPSLKQIENPSSYPMTIGN